MQLSTRFFAIKHYLSAKNDEKLAKVFHSYPIEGYKKAKAIFQDVCSILLELGYKAMVI
jgi:hypothetical protein